MKHGAISENVNTLMQLTSFRLHSVSPSISPLSQQNSSKIPIKENGFLYSSWVILRYNSLGVVPQLNSIMWLH